MYKNKIDSFHNDRPPIYDNQTSLKTSHLTPYIDTFIKQHLNQLVTASTITDIVIIITH